jgi:hypothetical protein
VGPRGPLHLPLPVAVEQGRPALTRRAQTGRSAVSGAVISIQIPGEGKNARMEKFLRAEVEDAGVEAMRKAVTQMMRKPGDYDLGGKKYRTSPAQRPKKAAPIKRSDDEVVKEL